MDGHYYLFTRGVFKKEDISELYLHRIDANTGNLVSKDTILSEKIEDIAALSSLQKVNYRSGQYSFHLSRKRNKILIHYIRKNTESKVFTENLILYDTEMNQILRKDFVKSDYRDVIRTSKALDEEGSLFYMGRNRELIFLDFYKEWETWEEPFPDLPLASNAKVGDLVYNYDPYGNVILIGLHKTIDAEETNENKYYKETKEGDSQIEGLFFIKADGFNKELLEVKLNPFDKKFTDLFRTENDIEEGFDAEMNDLYSDYTMLFADSMTFLVAQRSYRVIESQVRYRDLVVFAFSSKGDLMWSDRINNSQLYWKENYLAGFEAFVMSNKLQILFHDHEENFEGRNRESLDLEELSREKDAMMVRVQYDLKTGRRTLEKEPTWSFDEEYFIRFGYIFKSKFENRIYMFQSNEDLEYRPAYLEFR